MKERVKISELGERYLLRAIIFPNLTISREFLDEDAVIIEDNRKFIVINADTFVRSTDAPPGMSFRDMGYKTVAMSVSDVIAKGAKPLGFLLTISVPQETYLEDFEELIKGVREACDELGIKYLGGDLGGSDDLVLTGICVGTTRRVVLRGGARPGDYVWVTGEFGYTGVALHYLLHKGREVEGIEEAIQFFKRPRIKVRVNEILREIATAAMDSSDGLAITLDSIARASHVSIILERLPIAKIAIDYAKANELNPEELALYAGEEFEIVFTTSADLPPQEVVEIFKQKGLNEPLLIGKVHEGEGIFYKGARIKIAGWEHFR
ncbi:MAG: thiamine-phosphate kinase [Candidatus Njordarchaeales archaeon]